MGSEICSCLNDLAGGESEDLSQRGNDNNNIKIVSKKPKVVLQKQKSLDSADPDPLQSQKENNSISTNINSDYKNTIPNHQQKRKLQEQKKLKKNLQIKNNNNNNNNDNNINNINNEINDNNDINDNNNNIIKNNNIENNIDIDNNNKIENNDNIIDNNINSNININNEKENIKNNININKNIKKKEEEKKPEKKVEKKMEKEKEKEKEKKEEKEEKEIIDFDKVLNREEMVSENFNKFFNSQQGQDMILGMDDPNNKICITLHKYFVSLITRRKYKKNLKYFKQEKEELFQNCLNLIYNTNPNLKKLENTNLIKYIPDGYLKYYSDPKDIEKMKFDPKKESFDDCIIIHYEEEENDSSSIDKMVWIYKGQVNKQGNPHGFGEKFYKNGIKEKGYWKEGELYGWCMKIDTNKIIYIGPFYDNKGVTGLGEKFTWKKKVLYKGELIDGEKSGKGEEDSSEGKFVGSFYHDKKNGKGKMMYKISGDIYEGDYKNDLFDGQGHYIWKMTGQEYTGEYKNGLMHGKGLYEWSEGEFYRGNFVNGKKEGEGELHMGNGRSYIGPFVNGRPNGIGIFDNGINFKGEMEFIDGKMNVNYLKRKYSTSSISTINVNINDNVENKKEKESNG